MFNDPITISAGSFQQAWIEVIRKLMSNHWELCNLMVQIKEPCSIDQYIHEQVSAFSQREGLLGPKHVAYTIFPHGLYTHKDNAPDLFEAYNRRNGMYERLHRRKRGWGTYFQRMTHYEQQGSLVNQLKNIIDAINERNTVSKAAYTIIIQKPGGETIKPLGAPCLNYIAVQIEQSERLMLGLLAVYRNHDFLERAYGNYWGLCNLLNFIATEVQASPGPLTCVSSHAYVDKKKIALKALINSL